MDPLGDVQSFRIGVGGLSLLIEFGAWSLAAEASREDLSLLRYIIIAPCAFMAANRARRAALPRLGDVDVAK